MLANPNTIDNVDDVDRLVLPRKGQAYRDNLREMVEEQVEARNRATEDSPTPDNLPAEAHGGDSSQSPINPEEETFKKRYGDLRRYAEKQKQDHQRQIDDLRRQLLQDTREKGVRLPKTKEEVEAWIKSNPDVARIVETIAIVKANEVSAHTDERVKQLEKEAFEARAGRAESELKRLHPDIDELRNDPALHEWAQRQHPQIQNWLYDNPDDAELCAKALDLFKSEKKGKSKAARAQNNYDLEASRQVRPSTSQLSPQVEGGKEKIKESWINSLHGKDYEKYEALIDKAQAEGNVEYDVTRRGR